MQQELLDLAKAIDDNEDAINDALEQDDLERANELAAQKEQLFKRLYELSLEVSADERPDFDEYLKSLYEVTSDQLSVLNSEQAKTRAQLRGFKRGSKGSNDYKRVSSYDGRRRLF